MEAASSSSRGSGSGWAPSGPASFACMEPALFVHSPAAAHDGQASFSSLHSSMAASCCAPAEAASKKGRRSVEAAAMEQQYSSVSGSLIAVSALKFGETDRQRQRQTDRQFGRKTHSKQLGCCATVYTHIGVRVECMCIVLFYYTIIFAGSPF